MFGRQVLRELEALRPDLAKVGAAIGSSSMSSVSSSATNNHQALPSMVQSQPYSYQASNPGQSRSQQAPASRDVPQSRSSGIPPGSQSMFLPSASHHDPRKDQQNPPRPQSAQTAGPDPLGGQMAQSMVLPGGQGQRAQTVGRNGPKRLDERQAAKLLAGGF